MSLFILKKFWSLISRTARYSWLSQFYLPSQTSGIFLLYPNVKQCKAQVKTKFTGVLETSTQKTKSLEKLEGKITFIFFHEVYCLAASQLTYFLQSQVSCWQGLCLSPGLNPRLLSTLFNLHCSAVLPSLVGTISMLSFSCVKQNPSLQQQCSTSEQKMVFGWGSFPANLLTVQLSFKIRIMPYNCFMDGFSILDLPSEI